MESLLDISKLYESMGKLWRCIMDIEKWKQYIGVIFFSPHLTEEFPIWWGEAPHIVYTLVENINLKGKTVVPFCTSISSGIGDSGVHLEEMAKTSAKTNWLKGRNFYDAPSQKTVNKWINQLNI